ncbi:uncharacterized protein LOC125436130 [Sphaerodactylus townsendi]|uniref:uncharacterized protein LOC125436130 n=1 Tax=Sphaerodactylus townsendi TaxID=933632 RepID=UPI0020276AEC|nr:uncharacterized protein LOC125436130 [Sphaerodactylus townsendi]
MEDQGFASDEPVIGPRLGRVAELQVTLENSRRSVDITSAEPGVSSRMAAQRSGAEEQLLDGAGLDEDDPGMPVMRSRELSGASATRRDSLETDDSSVPTSTEGWMKMMQAFMRAQETTMQLLIQDRRRDPSAAWQKRQFPRYQQGESVESFLALFEAALRENRVPEKDYVQALWPCISGDLAQLLGELTLGEEASFENFKRQALARFGKTEGQLREELRKAFPKNKETYVAFMARLKLTVQQWFRSANVETVEEAGHLIARDQFFQILPGDISAMVQARETFDLSELAAFADQMATIKNKEKKALNFFTGKKEQFGINPRDVSSAGKEGVKAPFQRKETPAKPSKPVEASTPKSVTCFSCGKRGHYKNQCMESKKEAKVQVVGGDRVLMHTEDWEGSSGSPSSSVHSSEEEEPVTTMIKHSKKPWPDPELLARRRAGNERETRPTDSNPMLSHPGTESNS